MPMHWIEATEQGSQLIETLKKTAGFVESGGDPLVGGTKALFALIRFLEDAPMIKLSGATAPLRRLGYALRDTAEGAKPPMLFGRPPSTSGGAPTGTSADIVRGLLAAALEVLIRGGEKLNTASKFVADEARKRRITHRDGDCIKPIQIQRWRDNINGKANEATNRAFVETLAGMVEAGVIPEKNAKPTQPQAAEARADAVALVESVCLAGGF